MCNYNIYILVNFFGIIIFFGKKIFIFVFFEFMIFFIRVYISMVVRKNIELCLVFLVMVFEW